MRHVEISQIDAVFAGGGFPIEFLLFFEQGLATRRLRSALKALSRPFWPAFGTSRGREISFERYDEERHYDEVSTDGHLDTSLSIHDLTRAVAAHVPRDMEGLVFFRVLRLKSGDALLFRMSHLVGDGFSTFFLLSTLAAMSRLSAWPLSGRAVAALARPHHRRTAPRPFATAFAEGTPRTPRGECRIETMSVRREELDSQLARDRRPEEPPVSHNDLLSAIILRRTLEQRSESFAGRVRLSLPVDVRRGVAAYGPRFFGNGLLFHHLDLDAQRTRDAALLETARQIRRSMPSVNHESYGRFLAGLESDLCDERKLLDHPYDPRRGCLVTNISRLPIHRLDFGRGRPALVLPLTIAENSAAILRDGRDYRLRLVLAEPITCQN